MRLYYIQREKDGNGNSTGNDGMIRELWSKPDNPTQWSAMDAFKGKLAGSFGFSKLGAVKVSDNSPLAALWDGKSIKVYYQRQGDTEGMNVAYVENWTSTKKNSELHWFTKVAKASGF